MCGIAGYTGTKTSDQILLVALERLKYRGYDSAGMVVQNAGGLGLRKAAGKLDRLAALLETSPLRGHCGIGHTRWATHGPPNEINCHPHLDDQGTIAVVHNGIIENHDYLRKKLQAAGHVFSSQTDTEVIPQLIAEHQKRGGDLLAAVVAAVAELEGQFAFAVLCADEPGRIIAVRRGSPLLVGRGRGEAMIASDVPALLPHATEVMFLADGEIADVTPERVTVMTFAGVPVAVTFKPIEVTADAVSKGSHDTFMAKEIAEQPEVLTRILDSRLLGGRLVEPDLGVDLGAVRHIILLACGTSWHAALLGKRFIEQLARVHVEVDIASEYRYRQPVSDPATLAVVISQSGETADTLAALRTARADRIPVVALVNVVTSTMAREANGMLPLIAGPEIGVASTKAYTAQILALYLFALQIARARGRLDPAAEAAAINRVQQVVAQVRPTLAGSEDAVEEAAELFTPADATVFLGRGGEVATAFEGALKLKEIAYIHAIGHPAGEFKHGPIALVTRQLPVVCICPPDALYDKMLSNLQEVRARAGRIVTVGRAHDAALVDLSDHLLPVPVAAEPMLQPLLCILPLQRYAYHVARRRGCDVDQPRNLAKSVTVE